MPVMIGNLEILIHIVIMAGSDVELKAQCGQILS